MEFREARAGRTSMGPHQPRSLEEPHDLRDFDLMVVFQASGCESIALRLLRGIHIRPDEHELAEIANALAQEKGYSPIFNVSPEEVRLLSDARPAVEALFESQTWLQRDVTRTRRT